MTTTDNDPLIAEIERRIAQIRHYEKEADMMNADFMKGIREELEQVLKLVKQDRQRQQAEKERMIRQLEGYAFPRNDEGRECVWLDRAISIIQGKEQKEERAVKE